MAAVAEAAQGLSEDDTLETESMTCDDARGPMDECIDSFYCASRAPRSKFLWQGHVHIYPTCLVFRANVFGYVKSRTIMFRDITAIQRKTCLKLPNSIAIEYWDPVKQRARRDFYTSFFFAARERACEVMMQQWGAGDSRTTRSPSEPGKVRSMATLSLDVRATGNTTSEGSEVLAEMVPGAAARVSMAGREQSMRPAAVSMVLEGAAEGAEAEAEGVRASNSGNITSGSSTPVEKLPEGTEPAAAVEEGPGVPTDPMPPSFPMHAPAPAPAPAPTPAPQQRAPAWHGLFRVGARHHRKPSLGAAGLNRSSRPLGTVSVRRMASSQGQPISSNLGGGPSVGSNPFGETQDLAQALPLPRARQFALPLKPQPGGLPALEGQWDTLAELQLPGCSVAQFWHVFLSDASHFLPTFYTNSGGTPVQMLKWKRQPGTGALIRQFMFEWPYSTPLASGRALCTQDHSSLLYEGGCLTFSIEQRTPDLPTGVGKCFVIQTRWDVVPAEDGGCQITARYQQRWERFHPVKGPASKATAKEVGATYERMRAFFPVYMQQHGSSLPASPSRRTTRRTGSVDIGAHLSPLKSAFSAELASAAAGVLGSASSLPALAAGPLAGAGTSASGGAGGGLVQGLLGGSPAVAALMLLVAVLLVVNAGLVAAVVMLASRAASCGR